MIINLLWLILFVTLPLWAQVTGELETLDKQCSAGMGLSCAKAAYLTKKQDISQAYDYYKKGCELKDETACFNMKSLDPKDMYFKKAQGVMGLHTTKISHCHNPELKKKYSQIQLKEVWHTVNMRIFLSGLGKVTSSEITTNLSKEFIDCTKKIVNEIQFPKPDPRIFPRFDYVLTIRSME